MREPELSRQWDGGENFEFYRGQGFGDSDVSEVLSDRKLKYMSKVTWVFKEREGRGPSKKREKVGFGS